MSFFATLLTSQRIVASVCQVSCSLISETNHSEADPFLMSSLTLGTSSDGPFHWVMVIISLVYSVIPLVVVVCLGLCKLLCQVIHCWIIFSYILIPIDLRFHDLICLWV